jgi:hypothetical protein
MARRNPDLSTLWWALSAASLAGTVGYYVGKGVNPLNPASNVTTNIALTNGGSLTAPAGGTWILTLPSGATWTNLTDTNNDITSPPTGTGPATITTPVSGVTYTATWSTTPTTNTTGNRSNSNRNNQNTQTATITAQ